MQKFNICLVQPDNYIHSYAFFELGELIYYSLRELGFEVKLNVNKIDSNYRNIVIGCHLLDQSLIQQLPNAAIVLNTEQVYGNATPWSQIIFSWAKNFEIWDYSKRNIEKFTELGIHNVKHLKIGFQRELARLNSDQIKDVDILFYGCINERRKYVLDKLEAKGLRVKTLFGVYGKVRDEWIQRSKIVLNHHFYDSHIFEIVRVFYLLTNKVAVVGEVNETTSIDDIYRKGIYCAKYEELVDRCFEIAGDDLLRKRIEFDAFDSIIKHPQTIFTAEVISG